MRDELRQSFALLPGGSEPRIWVAKPRESGIKKFIRGRRTSSCPLPVKRPAKDELRGPIVFSSHPSEPMVNERGLSDTGPGDDCNDVDILLCPCAIQKSDILLPAKNIASGNGQSGYGNLLRCESCWRLASSGTRNGRWPLPQALTSNSTSSVESAYYRRYRLQKFDWALKTSAGVFLEEFLKENYDRLWNIFESFTRQGRVLMLIHHLSGRTPEWRLASHHDPERYAK